MRRLKYAVTFGHSFNLFQLQYIASQLVTCLDQENLFYRHCTHIEKDAKESTVDLLNEVLREYREHVINLCPRDDLLGKGSPRPFPRLILAFTANIILFMNCWFN